MVATFRVVRFGERDGLSGQFVVLEPCDDATARTWGARLEICSSNDHLRKHFQPGEVYTLGMLKKA